MGVHKYRTDLEGCPDFFKLDRRLLRASHWVSPTTQEHIEFPLIDKIIYIVMRGKWLQTVGVLGELFCQSQESIGQDCGVSRKKVNEVVGRFIKEGVIEARKQKVGEGTPLVYSAVKLLSVKDERGIFIVGN